MKQRIISNNRIRAQKVRLIDENGKQLGVVDLRDALRKSREANQDLIQVTDKLEIPVCKIMDYGKYAYQQGKKEKKQKTNDLKSIRLSFRISEHDMQTRANAAIKFLKSGDKVKIEMRLRGREKALTNFAKDKMEKFTKLLNEQFPIKIERELKRDPRGFTMLIAKS